MDPDFFIEVKCTIFGLNSGLSVYVNLYAADCLKSTFKHLFSLQQSTFLSTNVKQKH